jgi:glycosyltransferase involved in cell wall biosynthesis
MATPLYSFVVPIYGDGYLAVPFCEAIQTAMGNLLKGCDIADFVEVIFVNDGSPNNSQDQLLEARRCFSFVRVIELSRNFGQHVAVSCGYRFATGRYVGMINADQQDPPDQIGRLIDAMNAGNCDIAIGLRSERAESWLNSFTSRAFHAGMNLLTGAKTPVNAATLRIMSRQFVDAYNQLSEKTPYIPGLENWLGFRHVYVPIRHQARISGKSTYSFRKRWRLAVESIIGFSDLPLRIAATLGFAITSIGMLLSLGLVIQKLFFTKFAPGYTSTITIVVFLGGLNLMFLGLVSLYVGRILREVQGRPQYIVKSYDGFRQAEGGIEALRRRLARGDEANVFEKAPR